ncbi:response regulator [Novosphingobium beihaiensis]|uniref:Response regulator n=1 Tax=Novosphingobium beihaiensis TaxID=2930389 RepID=A0ABT0BPM1_9SPHN|nr:response regulator [Novosphingobium beihaiensis]MCJ2187007.1 response regulator [Novosphingobium beihaiensis]
MTAEHTAPCPPAILVVDDVEGNRAVVCRRLEQAGYTLFQAETGPQALQCLRSQKIDLVLLDYMMPNMSGIDVLKVLREDWKMDALPVIMLTARAEAQAQVEALEAGADDYVTKPIDFEVLRARIESHLVKHKTSDLLRQANAAADERAALRVLAIDQLRDELENEIALRRAAERAVAEMQNGPAHGTISALPEDLERALSIIDAMARQLDEGRPVNRALLRSLRTLVQSFAA